MILPSPGVGTALILFLTCLCFWFSELGLKEWQKRLGTRGWIPEHLDTGQKMCRAVSITALVFSGIALLPPLFDPLIPIGFIAFVLMIIWSIRSPLKDLVAGWLLHSEEKILPNTYVQLDSFLGKVHQVGFRTTTLEDGKGQRLIIPNHRLVTQKVMLDSTSWPLVSIPILLPDGTTADEIHHVLHHMVICSPWVAPEPIQIENSGDPKEWTLHARILELRFQEVFAASIRERINEHLRSHQ